MAIEYGEGEMCNMHYLIKAADLGIPEAKHNLALFYMGHEKEKYLHYITLTASQGHFKACVLFVSLSIHAKCGLTQSLILANLTLERT